MPVWLFLFIFPNFLHISSETIYFETEEGKSAVSRSNLIKAGQKASSSDQPISRDPPSQFMSIVMVSHKKVFFETLIFPICGTIQWLNVF